jgi:deoxyhypusine synthase
MVLLVVNLKHLHYILIKGEKNNGICKRSEMEKKITVKEYVQRLGSVGFQSVELKRASEVIVKMKKNLLKHILTFTSNMVTSGLRGFFAQLVELKMCRHYCNYCRRT